MIPLGTAKVSPVLRIEGADHKKGKHVHHGCTGPEMRFPLGLRADFQGFIEAVPICLTRSSL